MKQEIYYFEEPGPKNTEQTINIAHRRTKELNIDQIREMAGTWFIIYLNYLCDVTQKGNIKKGDEFE